MSTALVIVLILAGVFGIAGTLGVAYAVLRSSSEAKVRELDKRIIENYAALVTQLESEKSGLVTALDNAERRAADYREALTQKAAVDHLAEMVERQFRQQADVDSAHTVLLKDILAQLKRLSNGGSVRGVG